MSYVDIVQEMVPLTFYLYRFDFQEMRPFKRQKYECYEKDINVQNHNLFKWEVVFLSKDQRRLLPEYLLAQGWKYYFKAMTYLLNLPKSSQPYPAFTSVSNERIAEALRRMRVLASGGLNCLPAQYFLGSCCQLGYFVPKNNDDAFKYYDLAVKHDFLEAQLRLAKLYYQEYCFRIKQRIVQERKEESIEAQVNARASKVRVIAFQYALFDLYNRSSVDHDKNIEPMMGLSDREILEKSLSFYKLADMHPKLIKRDEISLLQNVTKSEANRFNMSTVDLSKKSILSSVLFTVEHTSLDCVSRVVQIWLYGFKDCFSQIYDARYDHNMDAIYLREGADLLYKNMDVQFDLLPLDTLMHLLTKLAGMIYKAINFNPNNTISSEQEVLDSFLVDLPVKPRKMAKKKTPVPKNIQPNVECVKKIAAPVLDAEPKIAIPSDVKVVPKVTAMKKEKLKKGKQKADVSHQVIKDIFQKIAELEQKMIHYYLEKSKPQMQKLFQALFDKDDMSFSNVNKLIPYIAEIENGSTRELVNGNGMNLLILGEFTCGGHRPHHGEINVDRGALASLRSVLSSHYKVKIHEAKLI